MIRPFERRCVCAMHSRPWWKHREACDTRYLADFLEAVRAVREVWRSHLS